MKLLTIRLSTLLLALSMLALPFAAGAATPSELDAKVKTALSALFSQEESSKAVADNAAGILVFPEVNKSGLLVAGTEYGEGALLEDGKTTGYYSSSSTTLGPQFGAQLKSQAFMFMTQDALNDFKNRKGMKVGLDGGVAVVNVSPGGAANPSTDAPVVAYTFSSSGMTLGVAIEGTVIRTLNIIELSGVKFKLNSAELTPASMATLDSAVATLKQRGNPDVEVAAHTCNIGSNEYNQILSDRRAESVMQYLTSHGVSADTITSKGYGATQPVGNNETREGRRENRRVELRVME